VVHIDTALVKSCWKFFLLVHDLLHGIYKMVQHDLVVLGEGQMGDNVACVSKVICAS
jgi:hypothetical protein